MKERGGRQETMAKPPFLFSDLQECRRFAEDAVKGLV